MGLQSIKLAERSSVMCEFMLFSSMWTLGDLRVSAWQRTVGYRAKRLAFRGAGLGRSPTAEGCPFLLARICGRRSSSAIFFELTYRLSALFISGENGVESACLRSPSVETAA